MRHVVWAWVGPLVWQLAHHRRSPSSCAALAEGVTAGLCLGDKGGEAEHEKDKKEERLGSLHYVVGGLRVGTGGGL